MDTNWEANFEKFLSVPLSKNSLSRFSKIQNSWFWPINALSFSSILLLSRLKKPESAVSSEDRERTKRIVYASLYGAGACKLMDILQISYDQTLSVISSFNSNGFIVIVLG